MPKERNAVSGIITYFIISWSKGKMRQLIFIATLPKVLLTSIRNYMDIFYGYLSQFFSFLGLYLLNLVANYIVVSSLVPYFHIIKSLLNFMNFGKINYSSSNSSSRPLSKCLSEDIFLLGFHDKNIKSVIKRCFLLLN